MNLRIFVLYLGLVFAGLTGCTPEPGPDLSRPDHQNADTIPHAMLGDNITPTEYRLDLRIDPDEDGFAGHVEIDILIGEPTDKIWLHAKSITVSRAVARVPGIGEIAMDFNPVPEADAPSGIAYLLPETPLPAGVATLSLDYTTPYNLALNSAYKVERAGEAYIVTQFEPLGAREAFPGFDEPRFKVPFTLSISAPKEDFVYANTPVVNSEPAEAGWIKHSFAITPPLPTYLVAFGVGPYDVVEYDDLPETKVRKHTVPLRGIAARGMGEQMQYALENTAGILEALEAYFGIPYPYRKLDLIAAPEYAFGAMENPGAIVYREYLLLLDENSPQSQKRAYAAVHSHELAHQWFGNLVTPFWWEDIWLNEAFATWMGNKGIHIWQPDRNFDRMTLNSALTTMNLDALANTRKIREPLLRSERVIDQFDSITYRKGGAVLSMFESYLGEEVFRDGVRLHMKRFAGKVATADDFFRSLADASVNPEIVMAMKSFVDQPGLPLVQGEMQCRNGLTFMKLEQSRYAPLGSKIQTDQLWRIPVCAEFGFGDSSEKVCTLMSDQKTELLPDTEACASWVTLNENGAGYYRFSLDTNGWLALFDNIGALNAREVLTVWDSLEAAFKVGDVEPQIFLRGMEIFAAHPEYDVVSATGDQLIWMYAELPPETRKDQARLVRDMYQARFARIRGTDTVEGNLLAPGLARHLVYRGEDIDLQNEFATKGAAYLGLDGERDQSALAANMLRLGLEMVMRQRPDEALQPLLDLVTSGSAREKSIALDALGKTLNLEIADRLRDIALNDSEAMTGRQASTLIYNLIHSKIHGAETWVWFQDNFDDFVKNRIPDVRRPSTSSYASGCSLPERDGIAAFFTQKAELIPGYERKLAQTLEGIELCAARKEELSAGLITALADRPGSPN